jgi:hypothetical protein
VSEAVTVDPETRTVIVARAYRTADLALATTKGCKTVEQLTQDERDLLEVGILAGIAAHRGWQRERRR